jgi:hypothetical protein
MPGDPNYSNVSLLLLCNGPNLSQEFVDHSLNNMAVTTNGDAKISASESVFGGSSAFFDGTGDYLTVPSNVLLGFGTGDFTVEFFVYFPSLPASTPKSLMGTYVSSSSGWLVQWHNSSGNVLRFLPSGDSPIYNFSWTPGVNTWYHIAVTRSGSYLRAFVDGTQIGATQTDTTNIATNLFTVGRLNLGAGSQYFGGYLDAIRITKGVARYTANFTPPAIEFYSHVAQITGDIIESLPIADWRVTAFRCKDGAYAGTTTTNGSTYTINVHYLEPCIIVLSPKIDYAWTAEKVATVDDCVVPANPDVTPHLFKVTSVTGDAKFGTSEPTYNFSGTTTSGNVTLTYIGPLVDPKSLGPKMPALV